MKTKTFEIDNYKIPYSLIDNHSKDTLLCIHGFNSSRKFIGKIHTMKLNFNLISISLPGSKEVEAKGISIDFLSKIIEKVILKIKNSRVYLLGHSLGGALISTQYNNLKVNKYFFVSPYHPFVSKTKVANLLQDYLKPDNTIKKAKKVAVKGALWAFNKIKNLDNGALLEESLWFDIAKNELFNPELIKKLDENFQKLNGKSKFIVGTNDRVISTESLKKYTETLKQPLTIIKGDHNPFKTNLKEMVLWLNNSIAYKKRYFSKLRKITK